MRALSPEFDLRPESDEGPFDVYLGPGRAVSNTVGKACRYRAIQEAKAGRLSK